MDEGTTDQRKSFESISGAEEKEEGSVPSPIGKVIVIPYEESSNLPFNFEGTYFWFNYCTFSNTRRVSNFLN